MSWKNDGKKAMWVEGSLNGNGKRIRITKLLDDKSSEALKPIENLGEIPYAKDYMIL